MRAVTFQAPNEVRIEEKPDPEVGSADEALIRVGASGICGSDLHIYHGRVPVEQGFTIGHEYVGTVLDAGSGVDRVAVGDRVLGCFHTACAPARPACAATTTAASSSAPSATGPTSATCRGRRPSS